MDITSKNIIYFDSIELLNFKNISEIESNLVLKWRNNIDIRKWMYDSNIIELDEHNSFIDNLYNDKKNLYFLVKKEEYIGVVYLNKINYKNQNAYLGIYKNPNTTISGKTLMDCLFYLAFEKLSLHTLKLEVREDNIKAIKFYESCGFKVEGCLIDFVKSDDSWRNVLIMGKINDV